MRRTVLALVLLPTLAAQVDDQALIDYLDRSRTDSGAPGIAAAVSLDGQPLGVLHDVVPDDGRAAKLGVVGVPQTFIFDPKTKTPVPVISGFPSAAQYVSALRQAAALILKG